MKRYKSNEIRVFDAFCAAAVEKTNSKPVTLTEIAAKMGISRQALVKSYFPDVDNIVASLHNYVDEEIFEMFRAFVDSGNRNLFVFLADEVFPILYRKRKYLHALYDTNADSSWLTFVVRKYSLLFQPFFSESEERIGLKPAFVAKCVVCNVIALISAWLRSPSPESPEQFGRKLLTLMSLSFDEVIG
jgi:AcrR family transcriptional regulator